MRLLLIIIMILGVLGLASPAHTPYHLHKYPTFTLIKITTHASGALVEVVKYTRHVTY